MKYYNTIIRTIQGDITKVDFVTAIVNLHYQWIDGLQMQAFHYIYGGSIYEKSQTISQ